MKTIDYAIQMEQEGEQYYLRQAEKHPGDVLRQVFTALAKAENRHGELLKNRAEGTAYELFEDRLLTEAKTVFSRLADYKNEIFDVPGQLEIYRLAADMEQKSISLYQGMLKDAAAAKDLELLKYLIRQEQDHLDLFEELALMLNRPVEWVESAEFGPREEY